MLSVIRQRAGVLMPICKEAFQSRLRSTAVAQPSAADVAAQSTVALQQAKTQKQIEQWDKANDVYYGPDRDMVNFPPKKIPMDPPPVRMYFIPNWFFEKFYAKTGVTGPYLFGTGLLTTLLSKEMLVVEGEFTDIITFWPAVAIVVWLIGNKTATLLDDYHAAVERRNYVAPLQRAKTAAKVAVDEGEKAIWCEYGQKFLYEAKQENIDLQLEAVYRKRLADAHTAVKRRLDYQVDLQNIKKNFEQKHMVDWVTNNVTKSITPALEKDIIAKCITDLQMLSSKA